LPAGAQIAGGAEVPAVLTRDALTTEISFLVSMDKRPEIRRVFPPRGGASAAAKPTPSRPAGTRSIRRTTPTVPVTGASAFAIQIAALNDPLRAKEIVNRLKETGMPAYLVNPPSTDPDAPYRVRVGPYPTRGAAEKTAAALEKSRGEKLWVTREK
jgi:cell division septation protein DedD